MTQPMRRLRHVLAAAVVAGLVVGCTQGGSLTPAERDEAEMAVAQLARGWEEAWNAGDMNTLGTYYTADAIIMNTQGAEDFRGTAGVQQYLQNIFAEGATYSGATITSNEIAILGDHAYTNGTASATRMIPGGTGIEMSWKYVNLLERQDDGTWKIRKSMAVQTMPPLVPQMPEPAAN